MEFISFKSVRDFHKIQNSLQIGQELSITYTDDTKSYFIITYQNGIADFHNLNGPAYDNGGGYLEYYIYGKRLGINLTNEEFEKRKNQYLKELTFQ
jgi:hypothetical protein